VGLLFTQVDYYVGFQAGLKGSLPQSSGHRQYLRSYAGRPDPRSSRIPGHHLLSATYKDVVAFVVLILVLIFRPWGLMGEKIPEKV